MTASNPTPLVSILINNYNYGHFVADAIDSALAQTYTNLEVIVVDDGSTDHSRDVIHRYQGRITPIFKQNGGQASAFNAGFAACNGEIICFLDADDAYLPTKVANVVSILKTYQESYWCFHILQFVDAQLTTPIASHFDQQETGLVQALDFRAEMRKGGIRKQFPFSIPPTSGLCFTRPLLQQILPMPEASGISLNDSYVQFTALALGQGYAVAQKLSLQRIHGNNTLTHQNSNQYALGTSRVNCFTAYWLRTKFPALSQFTDKYFAAGLSAYWRTRDQDVSMIVQEYLKALSAQRKFEIYVRALYHYLAGQM
jgi:glycosyltransferase involved in cell wall biosynthesis